MVCKPSDNIIGGNGGHQTEAPPLLLSMRLPTAKQLLAELLESWWCGVAMPRVLIPLIVSFAHDPCELLAARDLRRVDLLAAAHQPGYVHPPVPFEFYTIVCYACVMSVCLVCLSVVISLPPSADCVRGATQPGSVAVGGSKLTVSDRLLPELPLDSTPPAFIDSGGGGGGGGRGGVANPYATVTVVYSYRRHSFDDFVSGSYDGGAPASAGSDTEQTHELRWCGSRHRLKCHFRGSGAGWTAPCEYWEVEYWYTPPPPHGYSSADKTSDRIAELTHTGVADADADAEPVRGDIYYQYNRVCSSHGFVRMTGCGVVDRSHFAPGSVWAELHPRASASATAPHTAERAMMLTGRSWPDILDDAARDESFAHRFGDYRNYFPHADSRVNEKVRLQAVKTVNELLRWCRLFPNRKGMERLCRYLHLTPQFATIFDPPLHRRLSV